MKKIIQRLLCCLLILSLLPAALFVSAKGNFLDVRGSAWYAPAVAYVSDSKIMDGTGGSKFDPDVLVSRAMLATVLYRLDGGKDTYKTASFKDNKMGMWYFNGIEYCARKGIVKGYGNGTFGVRDLLTRQDMMTMFYRYAKSHGLTTAKIEESHLSYQDGASVKDYARTAVNWCLQEGVVSGTSYTAISPKSVATRAQLAQILFNYAESVLGQDVCRYRKSGDNPCGIGLTGVRLHNDKLSFRLTGLKNNGKLNLTVEYILDDTVQGKGRVTISSSAHRFSYDGNASFLNPRAIADIGLYKKASVRIQLTENGKSILEKTLDFGRILQSSPDGAALYFKGERPMDCRILLYHHFVNFDPLPESYGSVTTPQRLEADLQYLRDHGYTIIPLEALIGYQAGQRALPQKSVILTFDDGYLSNYTLAYPVLQKYQAPVTIFATVSTMNANDKMLWHQMREMEQSGLVNIQSHSWMHEDHAAISHQRVHEHISASFVLLDEKLGKRSPRLFAYPHGRYTEATLQIVQSYNVPLQVTTEWRALDMEHLDLSRLPRINVSHTENISALLSVSK